MLNNLYIKDFILIDELNIDFNDDFSVFTGETGAGKSIFIDCIGCLIGDKLNTSMIRKNASKAIIEGQFDVDEALANKLEEAGFDNEAFIVTREINTDGKSTTRLNHRSTTVSFIKECLAGYVDIHCQHDNQYLLNDKYHLRLLDQYCENQQSLMQLSDLYKTYHELEVKYKELVNTKYNEAQLEIIKYQLDEINALNIVNVNEDDEISKKLKEYADIEKNEKTIEEVKELFERGILDNLYQFTKLSGYLETFDSIKENVESIVNAYYQINDDYETILDKVGHSSLNEDDIDELNSRLFALQKMKRKYSKDLAGLIELKDSLNEQLDGYSNREFILSKLEKEKKAAYEKYLKLAKEISSDRKVKAKALAKEILQQLKDLSLEKARFEVQFEETSATNKGIDTVTFMVSMNAGSALAPLNKVASGGELSRLMLGLKAIFAKLNGTKFIIFDEIDTGVSGPVSLNIGVKMAKLANDMQVFAVTHLPSVAACGNSHYFISKKQSDDMTNSKVERLTLKGRIEQLAILSNAKVTDSSLTAAEELFERAQGLVKEE